MENTDLSHSGELKSKYELRRKVGIRKIPDRHKKGYFKKYHQKNKTKILKLNKEWREKNREYNLFRHRKYREENKEHNIEYRRKYREENRRKVRKRQHRWWREYYEKNKEKILQKHKDYAKINQIKLKAQTLARKYVLIPKGQMCVKCNKRLARERHHEDYGKPLEVDLVCKICHRKLNRGL